MREKALSLGQSVRSFASIVRDPHEGRPKFLTCQKFIRPSDCLSREANRFSFPPVHCTNTAWQSWNSARLKKESHKSEFGSKSDENRTLYAQLNTGLGNFGHCPAEFNSNPNQTHLTKLINVFKITIKLTVGVFVKGWSWTLQDSGLSRTEVAQPWPITPLSNFNPNNSNLQNFSWHTCGEEFAVDAFCLNGKKCFILEADVTWTKQQPTTSEWLMFSINEEKSSEIHFSHLTNLVENAWFDKRTLKN